MAPDSKTATGKAAPADPGPYPHYPTPPTTPTPRLPLLPLLLTFATALTETSTTALLPSIAQTYSLPPPLPSLLHVATALGFILAAPTLETVQTTLGASRALALSQALTALAALPLLFLPPFPLLILAFLLLGFATATTLTLTTVANPPTTLPLLHAAYAAGALLGPALATLPPGRDAWGGSPFAAPLGLALAGTILAATSQPRTENRPAARAADMQGMFTAVSTRTVIAASLFALAYRAAEAGLSSVSGTTGCLFWGGMTASRLLLAASGKGGQGVVVYWVLGAAAVWEGVGWLGPGALFGARDGMAGGVAMGLLLGPVYPVAVAVFMRGMATHEQVGGVGVIAAFGSSGRAAAPFTVGVLAEAVGPAVLHPIAIVLFGVMAGCWYGLPTRLKRSVCLRESPR